MSIQLTDIKRLAYTFFKVAGMTDSERQQFDTRGYLVREIGETEADKTLAVLERVNNGTEPLYSIKFYTISKKSVTRKLIKKIENEYAFSTDRRTAKGNTVYIREMLKGKASSFPVMITVGKPFFRKPTLDSITNTDVALTYPCDLSKELKETKPVEGEAGGA